MRPDSVTRSTLPLSGGRRDLASSRRSRSRCLLGSRVGGAAAGGAGLDDVAAEAESVHDLRRRASGREEDGTPGAATSDRADSNDLSQHANLIETLLDERTGPVQALCQRRFWALPSGRSTFEFRWTAAVQGSELASAPDEVAEVVGRGAVGALEADLFQDAERCVISRSDCRPESAASGACCGVNRGAGGFGRVPVALVHAQQFVCQLRLSYARATHY